MDFGKSGNLVKYYLRERIVCERDGKEHGQKLHKDTTLILESLAHDLFGDNHQAIEESLRLAESAANTIYGLFAVQQHPDPLNFRLSLGYVSQRLQTLSAHS